MDYRDIAVRAIKTLVQTLVAAGAAMVAAAQTHLVELDADVTTAAALSIFAGVASVLHNLGLTKEQLMKAKDFLLEQKDRGKDIGEII